MFCYNCGANIGEGTKFCITCGSAVYTAPAAIPVVPPQAPPPAPVPVVPPQAPPPAPVPQPDQPQPDQQQPSPPQPTPPQAPPPVPAPTPAPEKPASSGNKRLIIFVVIAAVALLAAVFSGLVIFTDIFSKSTDNETGRVSDNDDEPVITVAPSTEAPETTAPTTSPDDGKLVLSSGGGEIRVTQEVEIEFTPKEDGYWEFETSDNGESDPIITIFNKYGDFVASDDDSGENENAFLVIFLEGGHTYTIEASFYIDAGTGSYLLTVSRGAGADSYMLSSNGDSIRVDAPAEILFIPDMTGVWEIYTSENGSSDPVLEFYDSNGRLIAEDDESAGDNNAIIAVYLEEGESYTIYASEWSNNRASFTVTVSLAMFIPSSGGEISVEGTTGYSFTPDRSGKWEFRTLNNGNYDPELFIYDMDNNLIADDDDSGGDSNAYISVELKEGNTYVILASFWSSIGSYDLRVSR